MGGSVLDVDGSPTCGVVEGATERGWWRSPSASGTRSTARRRGELGPETRRRAGRPLPPSSDVIGEAARAQSLRHQQCARTGDDALEGGGGVGDAILCAGGAGGTAAVAAEGRGVVGHTHTLMHALKV
jgi:hypothetical protein